MGTATDPDEESEHSQFNILEDVVAPRVDMRKTEARKGTNTQQLAPATEGDPLQAKLASSMPGAKAVGPSNSKDNEKTLPVAKNQEQTSVSSSEGNVGQQVHQVVACGVPTRPGSEEPEGQPGAYALGLGQQSEDQASLTSQSAPAGTSTNNDATSAVVPVANPVAEAVHNVEDLPLAQPEDLDDLEAANRRRQEQTKARKRNLLLGIIALLVLLIILVAVLVPSKNSPTQKAEEEPSQAPSIAPTTFEGYILSLLPEETLAALSDSESPQSKAFEWMLDDVHQNPSFLESTFRFGQRFAMATLYFATTGMEWAKNEHWMDHNAHECDWYTKPYFAMNETLSNFIPGYLVGFFPSNPPPCNAQGMYQHLWLDLNNLKGHLPTELYALIPSLKTLSMGLNQLEGSISTSVGLLENLEGLMIYGQKGAGAIPTELGLLSRLRYLALMQNDHVGQIPSEIWQLTNLEVLTLNYNPQLTGSIPSEIGLFSRLQDLLFHDLTLQGTLPTQLGLVTSLEWLVTINNELSGSIPSQLGLLINMFLVDISSTPLTGTIPTQCGAWASATSLVVRNNENLEGPIPTEIGLLTSLGLNLELNNNMLTSTLPTQLGLLTSLREISLQNNHLEGAIPSELGALTNIQSLNLANNSLQFSVPSALSALQESLYLVHMEGNPLLSGSIPEDLCSLSGACTPSALNPCENHNGVMFSCTDLLCGCDCTCVV